MATTIVAHSETLREPMLAFNARMRAAGSKWGFYVDPIPTWLGDSSRTGASTHRQYFAAVDDVEGVVGAYGLRTQTFLIRGETVSAADWQGPVSLGAIDPRFGPLGIRLLRDMLKRQPNLYSWGHGGEHEPMLELVRKLGWTVFGTPVALGVLRPRRVLAGLPALERDPRLATVAKVLSRSGLAHAGVRVVERLQQPVRPSVHGLNMRVVSAFDERAERLWQERKHAWDAISVRDKATLLALMPPSDQAEWREPIRIYVSSKGNLIGWLAMLITDMDRDARFGQLRVATIADAFCGPEHVTNLVSAARAYANEREADILLCNQAHRLWHQALRAQGCFMREKGRFLALSPALAERLRGIAPESLYLNNMDGHGPNGL